MAKCSFTSTGRTFTLEVTEKSYSIEKNTSDVNWKLTISGGGTQWYDSYAKVTVNGSVVFNETKGWGTGTFPARDGSVSGTITGIEHDDEGRKSISFALEGYSEVYTTQYDDGILTLTTIPRASSISITNYNLGQNPNVVIGKKVDSFTSTLSYKIGRRIGTLIEKTYASNYVWEMGEELINQIKNDNPSNRLVDVVIYCDTYDGNNKIGSRTQATFNLIITDKPMITNVVRTELNSSVLELTDKVLRHISQNQFTITATAPTGTTIKGYRVKNGTQDSGQIESNVVTLNDIQSFYDDNGTLKTKFEVICIDARGNESEITEVICDFIDYIDVSINKTDVKVTRTNSTTNDAILSMTGNFYNGLIGDAQNKVNVNCQYRKQGTDKYTSLTDLNATYEENTFKIDNLKLEGTFDYQQNYEFIFFVVDELNDSDETTYIFTSSIPTEIHHSKGAYIRELDTDILKIDDIDFREYIEKDTIYEGKLRGEEEVTLSNVKRFLEIYFMVDFDNGNSTGKYIIDTQQGKSHFCFGSGIVYAFDVSNGTEYYISQCVFNKNTNILNHSVVGYFTISGGYFNGRYGNDGYYVYRVDTYD